ncbi:MAG: Cys-tRNA(Pro) deacylase, partial [Corynebacterium sp.]|nr:Cys-tRNA(Pro) deacylase [Corynebacterium sp.]
FNAGSENFGEQAAAEIGGDPARIFKTLIVDLSAGKGPKRQLAVCCVPVPNKLNLKHAAAAFGESKAAMAEPADATRATGYIPGGISPLGQKTSLPTAIDASAQNFDTIMVSGGKRGLDIELAPADLAALTSATFADLIA